MMTKVRITALFTGLLILSAATFTRAQDPASQLTPTDAQTDEQKQKEKEASEKKATALLEQIVGELQLLKLPENRIRVEIAAGDLLWKRNEARARSFNVQSCGLPAGIGVLARSSAVNTAATCELALASATSACTTVARCAAGTARLT